MKFTWKAIFYDLNAYKLPSIFYLCTTLVITLSLTQIRRKDKALNDCSCVMSHDQWTPKITILSFESNLKKKRWITKTFIQGSLILIIALKILVGVALSLHWMFWQVDTTLNRNYHLLNIFSFLVDVCFSMMNISRFYQIGRAHVWTPVTWNDLVCRLLLEKKKK